MEYESSTLEIADRHRAASKKLFQQWSRRHNGQHEINNNDICHINSRNSKTTLSTIHQYSSEAENYRIGRQQLVRPTTVYSPVRQGADGARSSPDLPAPPPEFRPLYQEPIQMMLHRTPSGAQRKIRQKREENRNNQRLSCYSSISSASSFSVDSYQQQQSASTTNLPAAVESAGSTSHSYSNISPRNTAAGFRGGNVVADDISSSSADYRSMVDLHGYRSILPDDSSDSSFTVEDRGHRWRTQMRDREEIETTSMPIAQLISPPLRFLDASQSSNFSSGRMTNEAVEEYGNAAEAWQNMILRSTAGSMSRLYAATPTAASDEFTRSRSVRTPQSPDADGMGEITSKIGELHNLVGNLIGLNPSYHPGSNNSNNSAGYFGKPTVQVHPMPASRTKATSASPPETLKKPVPPPVPKKPSHMRQAPVQRMDDGATTSIDKYKINVIPRSPSIDSPAITLWSSKTAAFRDNCSPPQTSAGFKKTPSWKCLPNTVSKYRTAETEQTLPRDETAVSTVTTLPTSSTVTTPYTMDALASLNSKDFNNNYKENNYRDNGRTKNDSNIDLNADTTQHVGYGSFPNAAHSYSSSLDGANVAATAADVAKKSDSGFSSSQTDLSFASVDTRHSKFSSSESAGWTYAQRLKANSNSLLNLHDSLNHALFNPEEHSYDELVALEKRRRECVTSLTRKIDDCATDLATIDEDLRSVAQSRDVLIHEFSTFVAAGGSDAAVERLMSRLRLHKCEGDELAKLEALLAVQREKLMKSKNDSEYTEKCQERLKQQTDDTRMIRAAYEARELTLEDELFATFGATSNRAGGTSEKLLSDWRFCNRAVVRLNAERRLVDDALAVVRQQLAALEAITVLPRVDAIASDLAGSEVAE